MQVDLVGYLLNQSGYCIHPSKVEAIMNSLRPRTAAQLRSFMGLVNFPRDHIPHFGSHVDRLDNERYAKTLVWTDELNSAFERIKKAIKEAAELEAEDHTKVTLLGVDTSEEGVGFWRVSLKEEFKTIVPREAKMEHVDIVQFGSKAIHTDSAFKHAGSTLRELGGVIFAIKKRSVTRIYG